MHRVQVCLDRIGQVREAAAKKESAYLFRTRLQRLILSVQRIVVDEYGLDVSTPQILDESLSVSPQCKELAALTTSMVLSGKYMSQRSVALDERWETEWGALCGKIDRIEAILVESNNMRH